MSSSSREAAPGRESAPETPTVVRVLWENFQWRHRGGVAHSYYRRGQLIVGEDAAELLAIKHPAVAPLDEDVAAVCLSCGTHLSSEVIRAGKVECEDGHVALVPIRCMSGIQWHNVSPGELIELRCAKEVAQQIVAGARPGTVAHAGQRVVRAACPTCRSTGLYAVPKTT